MKPRGPDCVPQNEGLETPPCLGPQLVFYYL